VEGGDGEEEWWGVLARLRLLISVTEVVTHPNNDCGGGDLDALPGSSPPPQQAPQLQCRLLKKTKVKTASEGMQICTMVQNPNNIPIPFHCK